MQIETNDNDAAARLLPSFSLKHMNGKLVLPFQTREQTAAINRLLVQHGVEVYALHAQQDDLEQLFLDITSQN